MGQFCFYPHICGALWCIDNPSITTFKMSSDIRQKAGIYVTLYCIMSSHSVIWTNQKTQLFVYRWLCVHAMFDITCFHTFVGKSNAISHVLLIRWFQDKSTPTLMSPMEPWPMARMSNCFFLPPEDVELNPWPHTTSAGFIRYFCSCLGTNDQTWDWNQE